MCYRSLACTVVEMLTTNPPWIEFETMAAIFKIATSDYPKFELPSNISNDCQIFLRACFKKEQFRPTAMDLLSNFKFCNEYT